MQDNQIDLFETYNYSPFLENNKPFLDELISFKEYESLNDIINKPFENLNEKILNQYFMDDYYYTNKKLKLFTSNRMMFSLLLKTMVLQKVYDKYKCKINLDIYEEENSFFTKNYSDPESNNLANHYVIIAKEIPEKFNINIIGSFNETPEIKMNTKNIFLRYINLDFKAYISHILKKIKRHNKSIFLFQSNELIREIDASLYFMGIDTCSIKGEIITYYNKLNSETSMTDNYYDKIYEEIKNELFGFLVKNLEMKEEFASAYISITSKIISRQVEYLLSIKNDLRNHMNNIMAKNLTTIKTCLTNGLFGTQGIAIADALLYNKCQIISVEHGLTRGNIKETLDSIAKLEVNTSNVLFTYTRAAKDTHLQVSSNNILNVGAPKEIKQIKFHYLQNLINRKRLGFSLKDKIVFFVSHNTILNSSKYYPYTKPNSLLYKDETFLLQNVLNKINKKVIYKEYPSHSYLTKIPKKIYNNIFNLNNNEDFRYQRTIADIIITQGSESTLGWCLGANKPLVFLDSDYYEALADENVKKAFKESFFFFNYDTNGWEKELIEFLNKPYDEILALWNEKEKYREKYDDAYFLGCKKDSAQEAAEYIKNLF